ncbi:MAG TPA: hypothetical protein VG166_06860 [Caulobacteraceae bacterium]|nr:hypothetical protein [Caulobacteraceae bacterium]
MATRTITGAYPSGYYLDPAFQTLDLSATANVGGLGVTTSTAAPSTINNLGTVKADQSGVSLAAGGRINNGSAAVTTALIRAVAPVSVSSGFGSLVNRGSIVSTAVVNGYFSSRGASVVFAAGGQVVNKASGRIADGVDIAGGSGVVVNEGDIGGAQSLYYKQNTFPTQNNTYGYSVALGGGGGVVNGAHHAYSAVIENGVEISGAAGTVVNSGSIGGLYTLATSYKDFDYRVRRGRGAAVTLLAGGRVVNGSARDTTAALGSGVTISGGVGTVVNHGTIVGSGYSYESSNVYDITTKKEVDPAASLVDGGVVINGTGAAIGAIAISGGAGMVVNDGAVGQTYWVKVFQGYGGRPKTTRTEGYSISLAAGGRITNGSATDSTAVIEAGIGVSGGAGRVINYATIDAYGGKYGTAVLFGSATDRLVEEGSGTLIGTVVGGGGTLELAAAAGPGTIGGLGGEIGGFRMITVDAGAAWRFEGTNTIASGTTLRNAAAVVDDGTLTNEGRILAGALLQLNTGAEIDNAAGASLFFTGDTGIGLVSGATGTTVVNAGMVEKSAGAGLSHILGPVTNTGEVVAASGTLEFAGAVDGVGAMRIEAGATLEFAGAVASGQRVTFAETGAVLELLGGAAFAGRVAGFAAGDTFDLRGMPFGSGLTITYAGSANKGTLTVSNGAQMVKIALIGQYSAANFAAASNGGGGTDVGFVATPAAALTTLASAS